MEDDRSFNPCFSMGEKYINMLEGNPTLLSNEEVTEMANVNLFGNPTKLNEKKSLYSVLPGVDPINDLNEYYAVPSHVLACKSWKTAQINATIFSKLLLVKKQTQAAPATYETRH